MENYIRKKPAGPKDPKGWQGGLQKSDFAKALPKNEAKGLMPFASFMVRDEMAIRGAEALELQLPFDELEMLSQRVDLIKSQLKVG